MLASEVEVGADADGLDLVLEELAVGGAAQEVLEQDLHLARGQHAVDLDAGPQREVAAPVVLLAMLHVDGGDRPPALATTRPRAGHLGAVRSEEHTSELQSPCNLVCRLLLEKKNTNVT